MIDCVSVAWTLFNKRFSLISDPPGGQSFYLLPYIWLIAELSIAEVPHPGPGVQMSP